MPSDLWNFALVVYARPGVEAACLQLQEQGADVCLLLCALWLESGEAQHTAERADALRDIAKPWQREVISPLRRLRQAWRGSAQTDARLASWREQIKTLELQAEQELLQRLESCASRWPNESTEATPWLEPLCEGQAKKNRDALQVLRVAVSID